MKNILIFATIAIIAVFAISCGRNSGNNEENATFRTVGMEQGLAIYNQLLSDENLQENEKPVLLDVRHDDEYSAGHIPGAKLLTMETITQENAAEMIQSMTQPVFVYCRGGVRSKKAAAKLVSYGYVNITDIGGIMDYSGKIEK